MSPDQIVDRLFALGMSQDSERVIQGSRRPDGSYRKDVRVRAGYVPQDEQPVYVPRGALVRPL